MLERVSFVGQQVAENIEPPEAFAIISITDPDKPPARLMAGWAGVLRVSFHDVDPDRYPEDWDGLRVISNEQADQIADFCALQAKNCTELVVHCRYGVSRSAAVAKAVCDVMGLEFPADYEDHNDYIYRAVLASMMRAFDLTLSPRPSTATDPPSGAR